jgi:hypothetical protein
MEQEQDGVVPVMPLVPPTPVPLRMPVLPMPAAAKAAVVLWCCGGAVLVSVPMAVLGFRVTLDGSFAATAAWICAVYVLLAIGLARRVRAAYWAVGVVASLAIVLLPWPLISLYDAPGWNDFTVLFVMMWGYLLLAFAVLLLLSRRDVRAIYYPPKGMADG